MERNINKSILALCLLSFVLLTITNVYATFYEGGNQEKIDRLSAGNVPMEVKGDPLHFWQLLEEQLGNKPYPLPNLKNKDITLVLGETGVGKSVYINRLLGHKFRWGYNKKIEKSTAKKPAVQANTNVEELLAEESSDDEMLTEEVLEIDNRNENLPFAPIGHDEVSSCTKIPQMYTLSNGVELVDCPGFGDSDGIAQEMINLLMIRLFVEKAAKVNALMVLLPYSVLYGRGKGSYLLNLARQLDYLVQFEQCIHNILWCFTRCPADIKRKHIVEKITEMQQKKASLHEKMSKMFWDKSQEKKDMILLGKMLTMENRIRVASPLCSDNEVEKMKKVLYLMHKMAIDKVYFDFYHPKIDTKGATKRFFNVKKEFMNDYSTYHSIPLEIAKIENEIKQYEAIQDDPEELKKYTKAKIVEIRSKIATLESEIKNLVKQGEEEKCYRSVSVSISAWWFNDSKTIIYDDLRFERVEEYYKEGDSPFEKIEKNYNENKIKIKKLMFNPKKGIYNVKFTALGKLGFNVDTLKVVAVGAVGGATSVSLLVATVGLAASPVLAAKAITATIGGGSVGVRYASSLYKQKHNDKDTTDNNKGTADIKVNFYVKKKHLLPFEKEKNILEQKKAKLKKEASQLSTASAKAFLEKKYREILPQEKSKLHAKKENLKTKLKGQHLFIDFIGEVSLLLYPEGDYLNRFAKNFKGQFKLFAIRSAKESSVEENNMLQEDDEKKYDDNDAPPLESSTKCAEKNQNDT